jgi:hypothetical protein
MTWNGQPASVSEVKRPYAISFSPETSITPVPDYHRIIANRTSIMFNLATISAWETTALRVPIAADGG